MSNIITEEELVFWSRGLNKFTKLVHDDVDAPNRVFVMKYSRENKSLTSLSHGLQCETNMLTALTRRVQPKDETFMPLDYNFQTVNEVYRKTIEALNDGLQPWVETYAEINQKLQPISDAYAEINSKFQPINEAFALLNQKVEPVLKTLRQQTLSIEEWARTESAQTFFGNIRYFNEGLDEVYLVIDGLEANNYKSFINVLSIEELFTLRDYAKQNQQDLSVFHEWASFAYDYSITEHFESNFRIAIVAKDFSPERRAQIEEAFQLHKERRFWASCPLLLSTIEGIITEYLRANGSVKDKGGSLYSVGADGGRQVRGLKAKMNLWADADEAGIVPLSLKEEFLSVEGNVKINIVRNAILHGDELRYGQDFNRSTLFIYILYLVLRG